MFEKMRIKEHMEVADTNGQHVGTVDHVDGDMIRLTKSDSADGRHHCVPIAAVKRIEGDCVYIEPGTANRADDAVGAAAATGSTGLHSPVPDGASDTAPGSEPLFGTSGHGTGMGGSGVGR